jgi:fatty-acyl-CoA synthase
MLYWPDATIYQGIASIAAERPSRPALLFQGTEMTYDDLLVESEALAHGLADLGVGPGDRIAVWLGNRPEWIKAQLAASYLGAAVVAVNTRYRTHELEYMMNDSGCTVLLTEESFLGNDYLAMLAEIVPSIRETDPESFAPEAIPTLEHVVALESSDELPAVRAYDDVETAGANRDDVEPATDNTAPACIFYTSGTTSDPKGCLQPSRSLLNHSRQVGVHLGVTDDDIALGVLPFCGVWGYNTFLSALSHGIPLVVQTHFDAERTIELVETHRVTYLAGLATMFLRMLNIEGFEPERIASVERGVVGFISRGYDESAFESIESVFDFPLVQPYGLSEANSEVFVGDPDDPMEQRKLVGGPLIHPDAEVKIVDPETGEDLPPNQDGELCLRGFNVMNGYLNKPEETAEVVDEDGWFHSGDLGRCDEQGYFYYQTRLDDALRVRGFLVTPRDIETVIDEHPNVELSQVVGTSHPQHGQVPVAFVKRDVPDLSATDLRSYLDDRIADYKLPEHFEFVESFPRSEGPNGRKIQKTELRDRVTNRYHDTET